MSSGESRKEMSPSDMIEERIRDQGDWRGEMLARVRTLIKQAEPEVVEEWKWRGLRCGRTPESSAPVRRTEMS